MDLNEPQLFRIVQTEDESDSLWSERFSALYHSKRGACLESQHVFLSAGFSYCSERTPLRILEVGFGTGLNALLTWQAAQTVDCEVEYTALEPFPIPPLLAEQLNYPGQLEGNPEQQLGEVFQSLHAVEATSWISLGDRFTFRRVECPLLEFAAEGHEFSLVYYDAFSPSDQPSMWELDHFRHLSHLLEDKAVLVTYCASSQFKRNLRQCGFEVFRLPGCLGKREMTRAIFHGHTQAES